MCVPVRWRNDGYHSCCSFVGRPVLSLGYVEPVRVCDVCHEQCALRDAFLEVVRNGDLRATHAMLQHQHVGADDTTATQTPLLIAASKGSWGTFTFCCKLVNPGCHVVRIDRGRV